jgi:transposase InsO family protein
MINTKTDIEINKILGMISIQPSKFYSWAGRLGKPNFHNSRVPKGHWLLDEEKYAVLSYANNHKGEGYRRLSYMMLDDDIAAVSPSTTYRLLKGYGMLDEWNNVKNGTKGTGFQQPERPHEHWHTDIKYVNFHGTFLFLISVIDGYSRFIVHHELRMNMKEIDIEITIQKALEKFPGQTTRIISDNGSQFISRDFAEFLKVSGLEHIRTSVNYPQSNGKIERYHRTISEECLARQSMINLDDAARQIAQYVDFYNNKRLHSSLYYLTPADFLYGRVDEKLRVREEKLRRAKLTRFKNRLAC